MTSASSPSRLHLNGEVLALPEGGTLESLLAGQGFDFQAAFACAVNGSFVPRTQWSECRLRPDDRIDVVHPVTGG